MSNPGTDNEYMNTPYETGDAKPKINVSGNGKNGDNPETSAMVAEAGLAADLAGMKRLYELNRRLIGMESLETALQEILALAVEFMRADRGNIQLFRADTNSLHIAAQHGHHQPFLDHFRYQGCSAVCEAALKAKIRVVVEDISSDPTLEGTKDQEVIKADGIRAVQSTPLVTRRGKVIGMISTHFANPHRPGDEAFRFIDLLVSIAAEFIERAKADEALRHSEEKYRSLFNSIDEGYCLLEVILDDEGKPVDEWFLEMNPAYKRHTGLTDDILGKRTSEIVPGREPEWLKFFGDVAITGKSNRMEYHVDQIGRWFNASASRIGGEGSLKVAVVFRDVTELKHNEQSKDFLLKLNDVLRSLSDPVKIQESAAEVLGQYLNASRTFYYEVESVDGGYIHIINKDYFLNNIPSLAGRYARQTPEDDLFKKLYHGETLVVNDINKVDLLPAEELMAHRPLGIQSYITVPFLKDGKYVGGMNVQCAVPRSWTRAEITITEETAERTHAAVERAKAEKALRESEQLLRLANSAGNLISWENDTVTGKLSVSGDARDIIGFEIPQEEAERLMLVHPEDVEMVEKAMQHTFVTKEPLLVEHRLIGTSKGEPIWVRVSARFLDGYRLIGITQNIDSTKKAEIALRESEDKLRKLTNTLEQQVKERTSELRENHKLLDSIYNTTHVGMSVFKPVYNKRNKIVDFEIVIINKHIEDSAGRKDLSGKLFSKEYPGIKKMGLFDAMVKAMITGEPAQLEYFYGYDGFKRWYSTRFIRNDNMLVCSNLDLTEQKLAEEKNRQLVIEQQELEARQQREIFTTVLDTQEVERKRIAESLHNSLGQILYGVKLSLDQALKAELQGVDKENLRNADKLLNAAITESRRMSHELMPVILEDFGLKTAVEDICRQFTGPLQFRCRFKGLAGRLNKYFELAVYRVIQELMVNIVKHSRATEALVAVESQKGRMLILVQDNGRGFEISPEKSGGIGLKTIRNNVNLLNGNINMESTPGKGTVINIDIPLNFEK